MDKHIKLLGLLNLVYGIVACVGSLLLLILSGGVTDLYYRVEATEAAVIIVGLVLFNLLIGIPCIVAGVMVMGFHDAGRYVGIVVSAANLLNFPFGTALGFFGLWVFLSPETEMLFLHPLPRRRSRPVAARDDDEDEKRHLKRRPKAQVKPRASGLTS